jgi:hypothetical protein
MTEKSWNAEAGIPIRIVWPASYPKPLMISVENWRWLLVQLLLKRVRISYTCSSAVWERDDADEKHEPP